MLAYLLPHHRTAWNWLFIYHLSSNSCVDQNSELLSFVWNVLKSCIIQNYFQDIYLVFFLVVACTISYEISGQWGKSLNSCFPWFCRDRWQWCAWKGLWLRRGSKQSDDCPKVTNNDRGLVWRRMSLTNFYVPCPNIWYLWLRTLAWFFVSFLPHS